MERWEDGLVNGVGGSVVDRWMGKAGGHWLTGWLDGLMDRIIDTCRLIN